MGGFLMELWAFMKEREEVLVVTDSCGPALIRYLDRVDAGVCGGAVYLTLF